MLQCALVLTLCPEYADQIEVRFGVWAVFAAHLQGVTACMSFGHMIRIACTMRILASPSHQIASGNF